MRGIDWLLLLLLAVSVGVSLAVLKAVNRPADTAAAAQRIQAAADRLNVAAQQLGTQTGTVRRIEPLGQENE